MPRHLYPREKSKKKPKRPPPEGKLFCPVCAEERGTSYAKTLVVLEKTYIEKCRHLYAKPLSEGFMLVFAREKSALAWACDVCLEGGRAVAAKPWLQVSSIAYPDFAYWDKTLTCQDCRLEFVFSAKEQAFWYETLQFVGYSYPKQCPKCRRKRRIYKRHFHDLQRALEVLESNNPVQLISIAELYSQIDNSEKALEFFRRAKNLLKSGPEKTALEDRIKRILDSLQQSENPSH